MTQRSWFWGGTSIGDAALPVPYGAPYSDDMFTDVFAMMFTQDRTTEGVLQSSHPLYSGLLAVSNPGGDTIRVASGLALVDGKLFGNDANLDLTHTGGDGTFSVVLRKDFAAQTVRAAIRSQGVTQTDGTLWEIKLADFTRAAGVYTLTDLRENAHFGGAVNRLMLDYQPGIELIERKVAGIGGVASMDFIAIPSTYETLLFIIEGRTDASELAADSLYITLNNDEGANYDYSDWYITPVQDVKLHSTGQNNIKCTTILPTGDTAANIPGGVEVRIAGYARTVFYKTVHAHGAFQGTGLNGDFTSITDGVWRSTAAVNRVTLKPNFTSKFVAGSVVSLYGLA